MGARLLFGAIADDYTGGSDLAGMLASRGVRTIQTFGVPDDAVLAAARDAEAVCVSLKSRSIDPAEAVKLSTGALAQLQRMGAEQVQFKYCSTFDSTPRGNIGPVTSALMEKLGCEWTIAVPALPVNGRTQYLGYLFVNGVLLSDSPMRDHPLNPMTEPNLVRHLQQQTQRRVGLIDLAAVRRGKIIPPPGAEIALADAIDDGDLLRIGEAAAEMPLITGGSGITQALPEVWRAKWNWQPQPWPRASRADRPVRTLMLAGSCSTATLAQIARWQKEGGCAERMAGPIERLTSFCFDAWSKADDVLIYSSALPSDRDPDPHAIERAFGQIARDLLGQYGQLIVAGGETSGAVVEAIGIRAVAVGETIDPGVPALRSVAGPPLALALKSGNFGGEDFFRKAAQVLRTV